MSEKDLRELDAEIAVLLFGWEWLERENEEGGIKVIRKALFAPVCEEWIRWNFNPLAWCPAKEITPLFTDWDRACGERDDNYKLQHKRRLGLPHYTTNPADAFEVLKKCTDKIPLHIEISKDDNWYYVGRPDMDDTYGVFGAETLEIGICLFAKHLFSTKGQA